jgi:hypothetical protein
LPLTWIYTDIHSVFKRIEVIVCESDLNFTRISFRKQKWTEILFIGVLMESLIWAGVFKVHQRLPGSFVQWPSTPVTFRHCIHQIFVTIMKHWHWLLMKNRGFPLLTVLTKRKQHGRPWGGFLLSSLNLWEIMSVIWQRWEHVEPAENIFCWAQRKLAVARLASFKKSYQLEPFEESHKHHLQRVYRQLPKDILLGPKQMSLEGRG